MEDTMFCKQCGTEIVPDSKFCNVCGNPTSDDDFTQAPKNTGVSTPVEVKSKPRAWVIIFGVLLSLTILGLIIGIPLIITELKQHAQGTRPRNTGWLVAGVIYAIIFASAMSNKNSNTSNTSENRPSPSSSQVGHLNTGPSEYKLGDTIQLQNHQIMVSEVRTNYQTSNEFDRPQNSANMFVAIHVVIKNTSNDDLLVNSFGFQLEDETGTMRPETIIVSLNDMLESVTLRPDGRIEGNIGFEAKKDSNILNLHYSGGIFGGGDVVVNLLASR
jgi:hypothetical protein